MADRPNNRVSMGLRLGSEPTCRTCPHMKGDGGGWWGWCQHSSNRVFPDGWPLGFTPSQGADGGCDVHPMRAASLPVTHEAQKETPHG
jgi:hypothetical protein